jgi:hypothetical protein
MPVFSFRSLIEILLPGDFGSGVADFLLWPIPGYDVPLLCGLPVLLSLVWFFKANKALCITVCALLYMGSIFTESHTKYHYSVLPYTVPADQADPNYRTKSGYTDGGENAGDYTHDGRVWQSDLARADASDGTLTNIGLHYYPVPGEITYEESIFEDRWKNEVNQLVLTNAMTAGTFAGMESQCREYFQSRHARYQAVASLHNGGFMDRVRYREAIDKMNAEDTPITPFVRARDAEDAKVADEFYGPIFTAVIAFLVIGFAGKYALKFWTPFWQERRSKSWRTLFGHFTHGRVEKDGMPIDGPIHLSYPRFYINDTPYNLEGAWLDKDDAMVLKLANKTVIRLYVGTSVAPKFESKPLPKKPKFTWDYVAPKSTIDPLPEILSNRKSIFQERGNQG